jgi:hypothetical protein
MVWESFPKQDPERPYEAVGEISPQYLYSEDCARGMAESGHVEHLMVLLRDPMDRLVSHYVFWKGRHAYQGDFTDFIQDLPGAVEWGFYARYLKAYTRYFDRSSILPLVFERAVENVEQTRTRCARFLGVSTEAFPSGAGAEAVNRRYRPEREKLYATGVRLANLLRGIGADWVVNAAKRCGVGRSLGGEHRPPEEVRVPEDVRHRLEARYREDGAEL